MLCGANVSFFWLPFRVSIFMQRISCYMTLLFYCQICCCRPTLGSISCVFYSIVKLGTLWAGHGGFLKITATCRLAWKRWHHRPLWNFDQWVLTQLNAFSLFLLSFLKTLWLCCCLTEVQAPVWKSKKLYLHFSSLAELRKESCVWHGKSKPLMMQNIWQQIKGRETWPFFSCLWWFWPQRTNKINLHHLNCCSSYQVKNSHNILNWSGNPKIYATWSSGD